MTRLVTVAVGGSHAPDNRVARMVTARAARLLAIPAQPAYLHAHGPSFAEVMRACDGEPTIVVPLLLAPDRQLWRHISAVLHRRAVLAGPLGPHPLLAEVMCHRLQAAGARLGEPVIMIAEGSQDPASHTDQIEAARLLQSRWGAPVRLATLTGRGPRVSAVAAELGAGTMAVPYVLGPGKVARKAETAATIAGLNRVADVLGAHALTAELVIRRYRALSARAAA